ncbi:MAG TPA: RNA polymerase sigma-54 factor, partial [Nitrospiria bacterium]|nr:RNA polymerase sigma-54 factor [Nitrospiria bacterium]
MKARLDLRLTQKLIMTPQLQQAIKLLQLSRMELSQTISQEMLDNPLLEDVLGEETTPPEEAAKEELKEIPESGSSDEEAAAPEGAEKDFDLKWDDYFDDYDDSRNHEYENAQEKETTSFEQLVAKATSLEDHLLWQLGVASLGSKEKEIGQIIIGNIDENGYLGSSAEDIARTAESDVLSVEKVLSVIQSMDPPGVAARDLKECLLIQISQLDLKNSVVEKIISYHLEDMEKKRYSAISK